MDAGAEKNLLRTLSSLYNNNRDLNLFLGWIVPPENVPASPPAIQSFQVDFERWR